MPTPVISATGLCTPERVISNAFFDERFGAGTGEWLSKNLEIHNRRWMEPDQSVADLVEGAARQILTRAEVQPESVDLLIVATDTPEFVSPSTASVVQHRLGLPQAATFDLNTACTGFVTALDVASKFIQADARYRHALVIGAYGMSRYLNQDDKKTVTLFADGAAGVLVSAASPETVRPGQGWLTTRLHTEGQYNEWMGIYAGGARTPVTPEVLDQRTHQLQFTRKFPKEVNPTNWVRMIREVCDDLKLTPLDFDHYVFTQLNINSIRETLEVLGVPHDRAPTVMHDYGYTGSACIPMAFDHAVQSGRVKRGDKVMFVASGGGLTFAAGAWGF